MENDKFELVDDTLSKVIIFVCFSFCVLALPILFCYIRRRYHLQLEIKAVHCEQLWLVNYGNHLKNLKIKAMIANFVILILLIEITNNGSILIDRILHQLNDGKQQLWPILNDVRFISKYCFIPMLCMFLNVLWLAYLHCQYKYTIMRWTAYIILRIIAMIILNQLISHFPTSAVGDQIDSSLYRTLLMIFDLVDLLTYIWYSRRFYQHLKGRVIEAKFFKSRREFIENSYVCRHFRIATILVAVPLAIYFLINVFSLFSAYYLFLYYIGIFNDSKQVLYAHILAQWPITSCQLIYRLLFNFNYLYLILVSAYRYWRQKRSLTRVNDRIQPLVRKYQDKIYGRYYKYY